MSHASSTADLTAFRQPSSLERLLRSLFLRGEATRAEIGRQTGFSLASVTLGSQWLVENDYVEKAAVRRVTSKRPVEMLSLKSLPWLLLCVRVSAQEVSSELVDSTGAVTAEFSRALEEPTQEAIFTALGEEICSAEQQAAESGKPLYSVVLSIDGMISSPAAGVIFSLNAMKQWVACSPKFVHPILAKYPGVAQWTRTVCKLHGLAQELKLDHRIAYFEVHPRDLHFAAMHNGVVTQGGIGTSGAFLHQTVLPDGPACYCGRTGCLDALLRAGQAPLELIYGAIQRFLEFRDIAHLGLEWKESPVTVQSAFCSAALRTVRVVTNGDVMERRGLALLGAEAAILDQISREQPTTSQYSNKGGK